MKAMRWMLMLVFTALILAGVKGGNAKAAGCWNSNPDGSHDDNYFGMEETGREPATLNRSPSSRQLKKQKLSAIGSL